MPKKEMLFGSDARAKILAGVEKLNQAVCVTLGPKGRNVLFQHGFQQKPRMSKDGVTVAKQVELQCPLEQMGAQALYEVAAKSVDAVGDGTSTSTLLGAGIFREGCKMVAAGMNPMDLKRGIDMAVIEAVKAVTKQSRPVDGSTEIAQIGTISANGDKRIGKLMADAIAAVGKGGVISIEDGKGTECELEVVDGMRVDSGWLSPWLTTNPATMEAELDNPYILLFNGKLEAYTDILRLLEQVVVKKGSILIVCNEMNGDALAQLTVNKMNGALKICAIKSPGFGERVPMLLEDISALTGAMLVGEAYGNSLEGLDIESLGQARRIVISDKHTTIIGGKGSKAAIKRRVKQIKAGLKTIPGGEAGRHLRMELLDRVAKLTNGIAIVRVGGTTEVEMKELKDRVDDALHATKAAVDEGIVVGGGAALLYASIALDKLRGDNADQNAGIRIVRDVMRLPVEQIAKNAGVNGGLIVGELLRQNIHSMTYDAQNLEYVDAMDAGIIDPAKVVRVALQDAASIAGLLITTECMIVQLPIEEKAGGAS